MKLLLRYSCVTLMLSHRSGLVHMVYGLMHAETVLPFRPVGFEHEGEDVRWYVTRQLECPVSPPARPTLCLYIWTLFGKLPVLEHELAGVNAARRAQELATVVVPRDSSYLGTLVDDLVTKVSCATSHQVQVLTWSRLFLVWPFTPFHVLWILQAGSVCGNL